MTHRPGRCARCREREVCGKIVAHGGAGEVCGKEASHD